MDAPISKEVRVEKSNSTREELELLLFVKTVNDYFGYNFSQYQMASFKRRILALVETEKLSYISELIPKILYEERYLETVISKISIGVTELFRDPWTYSSMKKCIFPYIDSFPSIRVWHAGCSTGEEVYSLAIFLKEAGLLSKTIVHASDFNASSIKIASSGVLHKKLSKEDVKNYQEAGGEASLVDYFTTSYGHSKINRELAECLNFEQHNLVHDGLYTDSHLVLCRNVLIYFNRELRNKVLQLLSESLCRGGFLVLGSKESLIASPIEKNFKVIDQKSNIFQKLI